MQNAQPIGTRLSTPSDHGLLPLTPTQLSPIAYSPRSTAVVSCPSLRMHVDLASWQPMLKTRSVSLVSSSVAYPHTGRLYRCNMASNRTTPIWYPPGQKDSASSSFTLHTACGYSVTNKSRHPY